MNIQHFSSLWNRFPRLSLLLVIAPILLFNGHNQSLLSYDEGYYADQARWIWETGDWLTPAWWGLPVYDRAIGLQWSIALAYHIFGMNEFSARLPGMIFCIVSVLLTYEIGKILFDHKIAYLGASILMLMQLWVNEVHIAHQNTGLVAIELLGIWALLQITDSPSNSLSSFYKSIPISWAWGVIAGGMVGLGFMLKGFMIFVCIASLLPYLIFQHRYRQVLLNPGVYFGLVLGAIPPVGWLILSYDKYGIAPVRELFDKLIFLSKTDTYNPSPIYYFWNLPANIFPWALFSIIGAIVIWRRLLPNLNYSVLSLTLGYPITLFLLLSMFRTRMPYYTMQILPFMGLLAGTAFIHFMQISRNESIRWYRGITWIGYAFSGLGMLLAILGILSIVNPQLWGIATIPNIQIYSLPAIILGSGWATIPILWQRWQPPSTPYWLASWMVPAWFTMIAFGIQGAWTDKSPDFKALFYNTLSESKITNQPINLLIETHNKTSQSHELTGEELKTLILLTFYTPQLGKQMNSFDKLPNRAYAWTLNVAPELKNRTRSVAKIQDWQLIQKLGEG